eukprot:1267145-Lingulodinium_polyedra.AAC.1
MAADAGFGVEQWVLGQRNHGSAAGWRGGGRWRTQGTDRDCAPGLGSACGGGPWRKTRVKRKLFPERLAAGGPNS